MCLEKLLFLPLSCILLANFLSLQQPKTNNLKLYYDGKEITFYSTVCLGGGSRVRPGASAAEAYACYTSSNTTLTFYYDNYRSSRTGTTYGLNTGSNDPGWETDGTNASVTKVVFNSSFAGARPTTTYSWFYGMENLQSITGMSYLNTSEVTNMGWMFGNSTELTNLDLSHFNTSKVTDMWAMFYHSYNLRTVYVGNGWSTAAVTNSAIMFSDCTSLVGGQGTTWKSSNPTDKTYAHIDGGPSNPGYFTDKNASLRDDVNSDNTVNIADVTALIDYLLSGTW